MVPSLAYRTAKRPHTNNCAEVMVRLYKDVVLVSVKAYNVVAMVDFTVCVMEEYYWTAQGSTTSLTVEYLHSGCWQKSCKQRPHT